MFIAKGRKELGGGGEEGGGSYGRPYDHYCYRTRRPLPVPHICTSRTRSLRRRRQSGFVAARRSSYFWGHRLGSGRGWGEGWFASTTA